MATTTRKINGKMITIRNARVQPVNYTALLRACCATAERKGN